MLTLSTVLAQIADDGDVNLVELLVIVVLVLGAIALGLYIFRRRP